MTHRPFWCRLGWHRDQYIEIRGEPACACCPDAPPSPVRVTRCGHCNEIIERYPG